VFRVLLINTKRKTQNTKYKTPNTKHQGANVNDAMSGSIRSVGDVAE
jgi:hypothetical protein